MKVVSTQPVEEVSISAVLTRANGEVVDLGVISYWHRNPLKRATVRATNFLKGVSWRQ